MFRQLIFVSLLVSLSLGVTLAEDWPHWGKDNSRNMYSPDKKVIFDFNPGKIDDKTELVDMKTSKNVRWVAKLGSETYGNPTIADGKIFVGTNNASPRDPRITDDRGILLCLEEKSGDMLWQLSVPKLGAQKESDWEELGICSSPAVDGDRVYIVTNRCEVVCLDVRGQANGNDGPFKDEGKFMAGKGKPALKVGVQDADIIWVYNMIDELGVFPHNITSSAILVLGDKLFVTTSNGKDKTHNNMPAPNAPSLISLNKKTGKLLGEELSGISDRVMHCNWSSPSSAKVGGKDLVFFGGGDGWCYAFDPVAVYDKEEELDVLKEIWRVDCNPPSYRKKNGKPIEYATFPGPSEIIATPVFYKGKVYVAIGQDPEHENGLGNLVCIDASKKGDITNTGVIWSSKLLQRTISTVAIYNDLVFAADYTGNVHCLDANTGKRHWVFDTLAHIWSSPLVVNGHVVICNEDGLVFVLEAKKGAKAKKVAEIDMDSAVYSSAVAANGVLYIATQSHLYAVGLTK
jgi:outer membrane protein assembly factor BamB